MKRVLKKAIAFVSAIAVAASMAVSASAASATQVVKNGKYKQVVVSQTGVYFTNFSEKEIRSGSSGKTVLCVTPDGKTKKVKIQNSSKVDWFNSVNTGSVFTYTTSWLTLDYSDTYKETFVFSNGKTLSTENGYSEVDNCKYICIKDNDSYAFKVYSNNGKLINTIPYSSLKGVDKGSANSYSLYTYDSDTKSALFRGYDFKTQKDKYYLVKNNKTVKTFIGNSMSFEKDINGNTVARLYTYDDSNKSVETYYSITTGKKISKFEEAPYQYTEKNYSVEQTGSKYTVLDKSGKEIYSIAQKKAAGYYVYDNSVAIITKSGSKYGLVIVK